MRDMVITSLATQSSSVRCAICARPARRGATLCAQCKAAVKRARQVPSVRTELLPHPSAAPGRGSSPESGGATALPGSRPATRPVPGGWGTYVTLIAFGVAVCVTAYLAFSELDHATNPSHALNSTQPTTAAVPGGAAQARPPLPSLAAEAAPAESPPPTEAQDAQPSSGAPGPADVRSPQEPKQPREVQPLPAYEASYAIAAPVAPPASASDAVAAPPPPLVVETPEPVAPDRWQLLASATSRCERENPIAGLLCKERARLQYCEGYWGTAPQCPGSVANNNTR